LQNLDFQIDITIDIVTDIAINTLIAFDIAILTAIAIVHSKYTRFYSKKPVGSGISPDGNEKPRWNKPIFSCGARATNGSSLRHIRKKGL
jgi:hypothetical protein